MKKYLLFDLDGTLTDSQIGILNAFEYCFESFGIKKDKEVLKTFIGPPLSDTFKRVFKFDDMQCEKATSLFRKYYDSKGYLENAVYEGIKEILTRQKAEGKVLIVATSKPEKIAVPVLQHFGLEKFFDFIKGGMDDERFNQKDQIIKMALEKAGIDGIDRDMMLMVGDRNNDIMGAHKNGLQCAGVLYGYGNRSEMEENQADYIVETVEDLGKLLDRI